MNLRINELCLIDLDISYINILEIENKKLFSNIIYSVNSLCNKEETEEKIVLYENLHIYDFSKDVSVFFDLFNIDFESKKILNALNKSIANSFNNEYNKKILLEEKLREALQIVREYIYDFEFQLEIKENLTLEDLLKVLSLKVDTEIMDGLKEKFIALIDVFSFLNISKLLIFVNVKSFFSNQELTEIYKHIMMRNLKVLFVESNIEDCILDYEYKTIIDNDFCIYKKF